MKNRYRFLHFIVLIIAAMYLFSGEALLADGLNLQLILDEPDGDFFMPEDTVFATLILTDDDGNNLRVDEFDDNGLNLIELWVSGPRQNYEGIDPYTRFRILTPQNGFNRDSGFDPETGQMIIELPARMGADGSYTVLFYCKRIEGDRVYNRFASADFQLGQIRRTFTFSNRYLTCDRCHVDPTCGISGNTNVTQCVVCHADDYALAFNDFIHLRRNHPENQRDGCIQCHRAAGGVGDYGLNACYSCHNMRNDHIGRSDDQCLGCHGNDAYREHRLDTPTIPRSFDLIEPENHVVLDTSSVVLSWEESRDNDWDDMLDYEVELALDRQFDDVRIFDLQRGTSLEIHDLEDETDYWWRVRAVDMNSVGRYSRQSWQMYTSFAVPPPLFRLISPAEGDTIGRDGNFEIEAVWDMLLPPDPEDEVTYQAVFDFHAPGLNSFDMTFSDLLDTTLRFDWTDSVEIDNWDQHFTVQWSVAAYSGQDTTLCERPFTFTIVPNPESVPNRMDGIPGKFFVSQAYPNPFNSLVNIDFGLPHSGQLVVTVNDLTGKVVKQLSNGERSGGYLTLTFDGSRYASGLYLVRYSFNGRSQGFLKMLLLN